MCKHKYRENVVIRNHDRTVARLRLDDQVSVIRFRAEAKDFCLLRNVQTESEAYPASSLMGAGGKRLMHEADHTAFATAKVKNEWRYTSSLPHTPSWRGRGQIWHFT
jgi:hypothetical protein